LTRTQSASQTQTVSSPGSDFFDGTASLTAPIATGANAALVVAASAWYATAFSVEEADSTCGPGAYLLTQLVLAISRVTASSTTFFLQLYVTDPVTGQPGTALGSIWRLSSIGVPVAPSYVSLPLSGASFARSVDTSITGFNYSLIVTSSASINWHSVTVAGGAANGIPSPGKAVVASSLVSSDGTGGWTPVTPYRGMRLRAVKATCTPSMTPSASSTASVTPTIPSATPSQSASGFPAQSVLDNTGTLAASIGTLVDV